MNGHDAFLSKSLKPRHIAAMERYNQRYISSQGQVGNYETATGNSARQFKQSSGHKAGKYSDFARQPLIAGGKRNKARLDEIETKRRRGYRKNTRMGLFRTDVADVSKAFKKIEPKLNRALDAGGLESWGKNASMQQRMRGNYAASRMAQGKGLQGQKPFTGASLRAVERMNKKGRQLP